MKFTHFIKASFWLLLCLVDPVRSGAQEMTAGFDVCVYGGTSAGVIAAYTASKLGKTVLLVEPGKHLGGLTAGGLGYTDIGNKYAVTGLARDFYRKVGKHYGKFEQWIFEPHVAENAFKDYLGASAVTVWYDYRIVSASKPDGIIQSITLEHSDHPVASTNRLIRAKMFIDCSYEGDLMARAGVSYTVGREDNKVFDETYNGFQLRDKHQFVDGIDPYKIKGKPESGLLWGISDGLVYPAGTGDKKVQAYNFRICLSRDPANSVPVTRPAHYDSTQYELLIRVFEKEPGRPFDLILKPDPMPNNKLDINNNGPFSTDMIGVNYAYPEAGYEERKAIIQKLEDYNKGLLYFIGHDPRLPKSIREEMLRWGYPRDEYITTDHWSHQAYIREARRMTGAYVMTQANCEGKVSVDDAIGMAAYTMDSHNIQRLVVNGMVKNEGDVQIGGFPPYPIAYRSITPKATDCGNLLVPVCLSASHIAYGSIRMEPVFMVLGQSAATAAVMAIDKQVDVQHVNVEDLRNRLKNDPLADGSNAELLVDNDDVSHVDVQGTWSKINNARGSYGPSLLSIARSQSTPTSAVRFNAAIIGSGRYQVYAYFPKVEGGSSLINVVFHDGKNRHPVVVHPDQIRIEGQTSGEWILIGEYDLEKNAGCFVEISADHADGIVVADAVLIYPKH